MMRDWLIWPTRWLPETCNSLVEHASGLLQPKRAGVGYNGDLNEGHRECMIRWLEEDFLDADGTNIWAPVFSEVRRLFENVNRDHFGFDATWLRPLQFTTYRETRHDFFNWHRDTFWVDGRTPSVRKLTMTIQLSDPADYDGGGFDLDDDVYPPLPPEARQQGTILVFPSFFYHRVTRVTRGTRHCLVAWLEGPKWR